MSGLSNCTRATEPPPAFPFTTDVLPGTGPAMSTLLPALWSATPQLSRLLWPAMSALSSGLLRAFSVCRSAMSLIFAGNILCNTMFCPSEMACHVSSPARLSSRLLILRLAFAPGCHVYEGLPCLYIAHFECDKESNDLLTGGVPCPLARLDAGASCGAWPGLRLAR